jgi:hypothetical protein
VRRNNFVVASHKTLGYKFPTRKLMQALLSRSPVRIFMILPMERRPMNEQFTRQAQEMLAAAKEARIPENVQAFAEDSVAKTREAYSKMNAVAQDGVKAFQEIVLTAQSGAKSFGEKLLHTASVNAEAAFDAAEAIAKAKTVPEAARLQASFIQQQFANASSQTKELFELSSKIGRQTLESMNAVASKTFEQIKSVG